MRKLIDINIAPIDDDITIRLLNYADVDSLYLLVTENRGYLQEWLPWVIHYNSKKAAIDFIENSLKMYNENLEMQCAILYKENLIGVIGFHKFDWINNITSIGYWISEKFQGKGIISSCVNYLLGYAFNLINMNRVEIRCAVDNYKSSKIPVKFGFKLEGCLREAEFLNGKYLNINLYSLLKSDYNSSFLTTVSNIASAQP